MQSSSALQESINLKEMYNRKKIDIVWNTAPIVGYQQTYRAGDQIKIVLQKSRHMIVLADIKMCYRMAIQFNSKDSMPDFARKSFLNITPVNGSDPFNLVNLTFNSNSLLSQSAIPQSSPRCLFMNYYNSLTTKRKNVMSTLDYMNGGSYQMSGAQLNQVVGTSEIQPATHPYALNGAGTIVGNVVECKTDADPYCRAICDSIYQWNFQHNLPPTDTRIAGNVYFSAYFDKNGNSGTPYVSGYTPLAAGDGQQAGQTGEAGVAYATNFPFSVLMKSPSVCAYIRCQEKMQYTRMRFCSVTVSDYHYTGPQIQPSNTVIPTGQPTASVAITTCLDNAGAAVNTSNQRATYCTSISAPYGTQQQITRYLGTTTVPTAQNCTFFPAENFTNLECTFGETSIELQQIQNVCMSDTQVFLAFQLNQPDIVLSAYCQPAYHATSGVAVKPLPAGASADWHTGGTSANCQLFLQSQLLGSATYTINELILRIPYQSYPESSFSLIRSLLYQPVAFQSIRIQSDGITSLSSSFSQRISLGGASLVNGLISMIVPVGNLKIPAICRPQDTVIGYETFTPPTRGQLTSVQSLDALYCPFSSWSVFLNSDVYESTPSIANSNPSYQAYQKCLDGWEQIFGKHLPVDLLSFVQNRASIAIGINSNNNREQICSDSQLTLTVSFDSTQRKLMSQVMGRAQTEYISESFYLYTVLVCSQSLVNDDYISL